MPYVKVYVDFDLDEIDNNELIRECVRRKLITEGEGALIEGKSGRAWEPLDKIVSSPSDWDRALEEMATGRVEEALIYFERAVPAMRGCLDRLRGSH